MIAASKGTKEKFLNAQRIDMTVEVIYERVTSQQASDPGTEDQPQSPAASSGSHDLPQLSNADEVANHTMDLAVYQLASHGMGAGSERHNVDLDSILAAEFGQPGLSTERALIETLSEESFLQIADHIRLQKKVTGFALAAIAKPERNEGHVSESEQTIGVNEGSQPTEEELSDKSYQTREARSIDDHDGGETISMNSAHLGSESEESRRQSPHETQYSDRQRQRSYYGVGGHKDHPRVYHPDTQERPQQPWSNSNEPRNPAPEGPHWGYPSSPDVWNDFIGGASPRRQQDRSRDQVPNFAPPRAPWQQAGFYSEDSPHLGDSFMPGYFRQSGYPFPDRPTPSPAEDSSNPQIEQMKKQLEALRMERMEQIKNVEQQEKENRIREDAERAFKIRMEPMHQAQEEARKEIELAKIAAERAARERLEEERKAKEEAEKERQRQREYALVKAELEVRQRSERESIERKQRQGLRGLFNRSSKS